MKAIVVAVLLVAFVVAGCFGGKGVAPADEGDEAPAVPGAFDVPFDATGCQEGLVVAPIPLESAARQVPPGFRAGDFQKMANLPAPTGQGAVVLFSHRCEETSLGPGGFAAGSLAIYIEPPTFPVDRPPVTYNFYRLAYFTTHEESLRILAPTNYTLPPVTAVSVQGTKQGVVGATTTGSIHEAVGHRFEYSLVTAMASDPPPHGGRFWHAVPSGMVTFDYRPKGEFILGHATCSASPGSLFAAALGGTQCPPDAFGISVLEESWQGAISYQPSPSDAAAPPDVIEYAHCQNFSVVVAVAADFAGALPRGWVPEAPFDPAPAAPGMPPARLAAVALVCPTHAQASEDGTASAFYVLFRVKPTAAYQSPVASPYSIMLTWVTNSPTDAATFRAWGMDVVEEGEVRYEVATDVPLGPRVGRAWAATGEQIASTMAGVTLEGDGTPFPGGTERIFRVADGAVVAAIDRTFSYGVSLEAKHGPGGTFVDRAGKQYDAYFGGETPGVRVTFRPVELAPSTIRLTGCVEQGGDFRIAIAAVRPFLPPGFEPAPLLARGAPDPADSATLLNVIFFDCAIEGARTRGVVAGVPLATAEDGGKKLSCTGAELVRVTSDASYAAALAAWGVPSEDGEFDFRLSSSTPLTGEGVANARTRQTSFGVTLSGVGPLLESASSPDATAWSRVCAVRDAALSGMYDFRHAETFSFRPARLVLAADAKPLSDAQREGTGLQIEPNVLEFRRVAEGGGRT